ncbi:MAG: preprotein translocase subunit SecA [Candidatus Lernaella stagnicola]|nr:preprotein translocase subunit SecA [Candidatus Lernaella stagnicola]
MGILTKVFGTKNERELKRLDKTLEEVNAWEERVQALSDEQITARAKEIAADIQATGEGIDDKKEAHEAMFEAQLQNLPEVFAMVREAGVRTTGMRHFDVQITGGIVLWEGNIAEMKTGEGKTLAATLPMTLHAMAGTGAHLVTVNDYLAKRDAEWMGPIYNMMGLSVGLVIHAVDPDKRQASYGADITYGTNNEFGFDYLRDNMKTHFSQLMQRDHCFVIVDEVDSILIDEARTPLIISGPVREDPQALFTVRDVVRRLKREDHYEVDEKHRNVTLTDEGVTAVEQGLQIANVFEDEHADTLHKVENMLRAYALYQRDRHYIVKAREVILVDEHTGRTMPGRRLSEGLHQAIEAKENVTVRAESQTYATISLQNYFRMYTRLAGMTGTADTEAAEFKKIYDLDVVVIPTNVPMVRDDQPDKVYLSGDEKFAGVYVDILESHLRGQPVLVGTTSVEMNELVSDLLNNARKKKRVRDILDRPSIEQTFTRLNEEYGLDLDPKIYKVPHHLLNAKFHAAEALIVAQGGRFRSVTVATNMAGRGTDVKLGGDPEALTLTEDGIEREQHPKAFERAVEKWTPICREERVKVLAVGGLRVVGTERHESRRVDNQLRGRSGRQGDPGSSCFYLSLEDDLLRIFGDRMESILSRLQIEKDMPIVSHRMMDRAIERAQKAVEGHNFDIRKRLLEYDDVMNQQRTVIYRIRQQCLMERDVHEQILEMAQEVAGNTVLGYTSAMGKSPDMWDLDGLRRVFKRRYGVEIELPEGSDVFSINPDIIAEEMAIVMPQRLEERLNAIKDLDKKRYESIEQNAGDQEKFLDALIGQVALFHADIYAPEGLPPGKWRYEELDAVLSQKYGFTLSIEPAARVTMSLEGLVKQIQARMREALAANHDAVAQYVREDWDSAKKHKQQRMVAVAEQRLYLWAIDHHWMRHLWRMDNLRDAVSFRGYAQRDPLLEYKREGYEAFDEVMWEVKKTAVNLLFHIGYDMRTGRVHLPTMDDLSEDAKTVKEASGNIYEETAQQQQVANAPTDRPKQQPVKRDRPKVGRNEPCPCGSGKKYKKCCWDKDRQASG